MRESNITPKWAAKAPALVAAAVFLGLVPTALAGLGFRGFAVGSAIFLLTLALCAVGFAVGRFRLFWGCWGAASTVFFFLFGIATPVGMALALPVLVSRWF